MIEVKGPNVFKGYWRMPEKTSEEFTADGYFITGDVATIDAEGRVTIVGRAKDLIISGGFNVYPKEVEDVLDALPCVAESAVVGVPHPDFGEGVIAIVTAKGAVPEEEAIIAAAGRSSWRSSRCRSASSWWRSCRAMPWARCRRPNCAGSTATASPDQGRYFCTSLTRARTLEPKTTGA